MQPDFFQCIASKILYVTWTKFSWTRILYTTMYTLECELSRSLW